MSVTLIASGTGAALAAKQGPAPTHATVNAVQKVQFKINRYVKDALRWQKDTYQVKSGGTLHIVNKAHDGPHTFSIVAKKDLPRTVKQINECSICQKIGEQFGITDPNSEAPPAHNYTEDGVAQDAPANFDKPGDSVFVGPNVGDSADAKITAKKGKTLYFLCAIHPWMQAKVIVQ
jgi:LysM repeat protein